jgi:hypothetical protein
MGGALQSRHYHMIIQDDLVGMKTVESPSIMERAYEYHQLLLGAFDQDDPNHEADELIIGNRWGYHDLNSCVQEHETWFQWETHSALGGCCAAHPYGIPIFPEEYSIAKLERYKQRLGTYKFSCQMQNKPCAPEDAQFKSEWLRYFILVRDAEGKVTIRHETKDGVVVKDIPLAVCKLALATDPMHSQSAAQGRCRHSIVVTAMSPEGNVYFIDCWAKACTYEEYFRTLFQMAQRWGLHKVGFETCAGQGLGAHHIEYYAGVHNYRLSIVPLKGEVELEDGTISHKKEFRISGALGPLFEFGRFWTQRRFTDFYGEYSEFPKSRYWDILDALAYTPQMLRNPRNAQAMQNLKRQNNQQAALIGRPYSAGYQTRVM